MLMHSLKLVTVRRKILRGNSALVSIILAGGENVNFVSNKGIDRPKARENKETVCTLVCGKVSAPG